MVLIALAFAGLVVAVAMLLLSRGILSSGSRWLPAVCRMDADSCAWVVNHPTRVDPGGAECTRGCGVLCGGDLCSVLG